MDDGNRADGCADNLSCTLSEGSIVKRRVVGCLLSAVSIYVTMHYLTNLFMSLMANLTFNII